MSNKNLKAKMNFFNNIRHKSVTMRSQNCDGIMIPLQICDGLIISSQVIDGIGEGITIPSQFYDRFVTNF